MAYDNVVARGDVVIREEEIQVDDTEGLVSQSAARELFRVLPVSKNQQRFPILAALPVAYWVNGDTGLKQTTEMAWTNRFMNIEEIAVIVPVPQNVADDSDFDIWAEAKPRIAEAIGRTLDSAIFFGINAPGSFPTNVLAAARAAGNAVAYTAGTYTAAVGGIYGAIDDVYGLLDDDGFGADGWVAKRRLKNLLRKARNTQGDRQDRDRVSADLGSIDGDPINYAMDGLWPAKSVTSGSRDVYGIVGDWKRQFILGLRKDVSYEVFREGVIQDQSGAIVYNLLQQDMIALRVTFRAGWQVANTMTYANTDGATRYPAAVLQSDATA